MRFPEGVELSVLGDHAVFLGLGVDHSQDPGLLPEWVPPSGEKLH
jgi:hypothetical protein